MTTINFICAPDCNAEIVYFEENRPLKCWNCGRVWTIDFAAKDESVGVPVEKAAPSLLFTKLPLPINKGGISVQVPA